MRDYKKGKEVNIGGDWKIWGVRDWEGNTGKYKGTEGNKEGVLVVRFSWEEPDEVWGPTCRVVI